MTMVGIGEEGAAGDEADEADDLVLLSFRRGLCLDEVLEGGRGRAGRFTSRSGKKEWMTAVITLYREMNILVQLD